LITGVSSGIGLAAARRFADVGYEVVGAARTPERAAAASEVLSIGRFLVEH
jgi:NAD(P)-dependent dehydrogenase (short-subunit alcohol dehydrogenase family)